MTHTKQELICWLRGLASARPSNKTDTEFELRERGTAVALLLEYIDDDDVTQAYFAAIGVSSGSRRPIA